MPVCLFTALGVHGQGYPTGRACRELSLQALDRPCHSPVSLLVLGVFVWTLFHLTYCKIRVSFTELWRLCLRFLTGQPAGHVPRSALPGAAPPPHRPPAAGVSGQGSVAEEREAGGPPATAAGQEGLQAWEARPFWLQCPVCASDLPLLWRPCSPFNSISKKSKSLE